MQEQNSTSKPDISLKAVDFDFKRILSRTLDVVKNPKTVWEGIKNDGENIFDVYRKYLIFLVAIPAIANFIGMAIVGVDLPFSDETARWPFVAGLVYTVINYLLMLINVFIFALVIENLAPRFGGRGHRINALKLIVYSSAPALLAGIFYLIPSISMLAVLFAIYGIYIFYLGVTPMTDVPEDQKLKFIGASILCMIVIGLIVGAIGAYFAPNLPMPKVI